MLYEPREDSYLLQKVVGKEAFGNVLDVGTGTGIQAETALKVKKVASVTAVDLNPEAVAHCKKFGINCLRSDLFSAVKGVFDTIIFNAPYLPAQGKTIDIAFEGGKSGYETIERFLTQAPKHLSPAGAILLAFSSLTNKQKVEELIESNLLEFSVAASQHVSFEDLFVYRIDKSKILRNLDKRKITGLKYFARGKRGLVFIGRYSGKKVSIKVRRKENRSPKPESHEAEMLMRVNSLDIGPRLLFTGKRFVVYEFAEGRYFKDWKSTAPKAQFLNVVKEVLKQCRKLDGAGIAKEEMHRPLKHIIVGKKVVMIDFDRAHPAEKPNNVQQFWEYLRRIAPELKEKGLKFKSTKIIAAGKEYSKTRKLEILLKLLK